MARGYIKAWTDWLDKMERLSDASKGRLLTAILVYAKTGEETPLKGNEAVLFPVFKAEIDRDNAAYERVIEARREAGKQGGRPKTEEKQATDAADEAGEGSGEKQKVSPESKQKQKKQMVFLKSKKSKEEEKEKDKEKDKDKDSSFGGGSTTTAPPGEETPTEEEVEQYVLGNWLYVDPHEFYTYYAERGWVDSDGRRVKNWRAKARMWSKHCFRRPAGPGEAEPVPAGRARAAPDDPDRLEEDLSGLYAIPILEQAKDEG